MAQIKCKVCNNEYDESEASCPSCGYKTPKKSSSNNNLPLFIGIGIAVVAVIIIVVVLISGSGDTLSCSKTKGSDNDSIKITFKDGKVSKATRTATYTASSEEEANQYYENIKKQIDEGNRKAKFSYSKDGLKITLSATAGIDALDDLNLSSYKDSSKEDIIKSLEEDGFKCKK